QFQGHSPAGGCVLATCCEYRVMLPNFTIGLNETQFGLVAPPFIRASFKNVLPARKAELALCQGKMFSSKEALDVGLIDDMANTKEEGHAMSTKFLQTFSNVNPAARSPMKQQFRGKDLDELRRNKKKDMENYVKFVTQDHVQKRIGLYLEKLHNKTKK
ncbi:enoyl-CoA delta isomerase 1, mitochondrial-like, partial [Musca domestica]|uniref:Enoyl-CoA delta isomerase 1, mitochondrial-like n=1 Tax=Musca domestica TaxID=7370 RepID=A0A9J7DCE8_MUSDO